MGGSITLVLVLNCILRKAMSSSSLEIQPPIIECRAAIKCRAAVCWGEKEPVRIEEVVVDMPHRREVRVRMIATSVCQTDCLHLNGMKSHCNMGTYPIIYGHEGVGTYPIIYAHEGVGIVESIGEEVFDLLPGDHVIACYVPQCRECNLCKSGRTNRCKGNSANYSIGLMEDGTSRITVRGQLIHQFMGCSTFSEYTVLMRYNVAKVVRSIFQRFFQVNPTVPLTDLTPLGCCFPSGYGAAMNVAKIPPGSSVAIWGLGAVGLSTILGAKHCKASTILGVDIRSEKFELAKQFGATECLNPIDFRCLKKPFQDVLRERYGGGFDFTFECAGSDESQLEAFESSHDNWGMTVVVGLANNPIPVKVGKLLTGRKYIGCGFGGYSSADGVTELSNRVAHGEFPEIKRLITARRPFEEVQLAIDAVNKAEGLRTLLLFSTNQ